MSKSNNPLNPSQIEKLLKIIGNSLVKVDEFPSDCVNVKIEISELEGCDDNQILRISSTSQDDNLGYSAIFTEEGLKNALIDENQIEMVDHEGELTTLVLYSLKPRIIDLNEI